MNDLYKLLNDASKLISSINDLLEYSSYEECEDLSRLRIDRNDPEQLLLQDEFRSIMENLYNAKRDIEYLNQPIKYTGVLKKNTRGRYETEKKEYTSGNLIEALIYDDFHEKERWVITSVEHDGEDYYLVNYRFTRMPGLLCCIYNLTNFKTMILRL